MHLRDRRTHTAPETLPTRKTATGHLRAMPRGSRLRMCMLATLVACSHTLTALEAYRPALTSLANIVRRPRSSNAWAELGTLLHERGRLAAACAAFERGSHLAPDGVADIMRQLGECRLQLGDFRGAQNALEEAERLGGAPHQALSYFRADAAGPTACMSSELVLGAREAAHVPQDAVPETAPSSHVAALSRAWLTPIASAAECEFLIQSAEAHAQKRGGWTNAGHHRTFRAPDVVCADVPEVLAWLNAKLESAVLPALAAQFELSAGALWLQDAFIIKYTAEGQPGLAEHIDNSELSFNLLLSPPDAFEGGGTRIAPAEDVVIFPRQGEMLSHYGGLRHAGMPVSSGTRYILAGFVRASEIARDA